MAFRPSCIVTTAVHPPAASVPRVAVQHPAAVVAVPTAAIPSSAPNGPFICTFTKNGHTCNKEFKSNKLLIVRNLNL